MISAVRPYALLCVALTLSVVIGLSLSADPAHAGHNDVFTHAVVSAPTPSLSDGRHWLASWGASPQAPSAANPNSERGFDHATLRQVVFSTVGGSEVRVRFSNLYGTEPLQIGRASVGLASTGASVVPGSSRQLTFGGSPSFTIPPGAELFSDPVALTVPPLARLSVSLYTPSVTGPASQHMNSHELGYVATGSHILDDGAGPFTRRIASWYFLDGLDVMAPRADLGALVTLGDSITAGVGSALGADANWPDDLARRLGALPGESLSVVNEGIGGNRVLNNSRCCGINAVARFERDVADQTGVRDVILLEGVNDIGYSQKQGLLSAPHTNVSAAQIIAGDRAIIGQAHAAGLRIFGGTIAPFQGARYWTPAGESKREAVNHWILSSGAFDGVIDFARVLADPSNPERLNPAYNSGDHLHPNDAGYQAMAGAVNLAMLVRGDLSAVRSARRATRAAPRSPARVSPDSPNGRRPARRHWREGRSPSHSSTPRG